MKISASPQDLRGGKTKPRGARDRHRSVATVCAGFVALVAALVLFGWVGDVDLLKRMIPGVVAMNPMTAVAFLFAAASLWGVARYPAAVGLSAKRVLGGGALLVAAIGGVRLAALMGGPDLSVDRWLFTAKLAWSEIPSRIAPNTAFNLVLIGGALLLLHSAHRRVSVWASAPALLCGFISLVVVLGYA